MKTVKVVQAARILGKSPDFIRWGLRENKFPFGTAVQSQKGKRWNYLIIPKLFVEYTGIQEEDLWK